MKPDAPNNSKILRQIAIKATVKGTMENIPIPATPSTAKCTSAPTAFSQVDQSGAANFLVNFLLCDGRLLR
jgi:hypothetical protein